jgi:hypothetical protein
MFIPSNDITMDRPRAIERNRDALTGIVAALFTMLGLVAGAAIGRIPRHLHRAVLRVLRPAESAVRRLIVVVARGLVVKPAPSRPIPAGGIAGKGGARRPAFPLFDPRKNFAPRRRYVSERLAPRVLLYWNEDGELVSPRRDPPPPPDDGLIDATRLGRRLEALKLALADLPRQARRLVRAKARRERLRALRPTFVSPIRPGHPPGHRKKPVHEVDDVLFNCHLLARDAERHDTS